MLQDFDCVLVYFKRVAVDLSVKPKYHWLMIIHWQRTRSTLFKMLMAWIDVILDLTLINISPSLLFGIWTQYFSFGIFSQSRCKLICRFLSVLSIFNIHFQLSTFISYKCISPIQGYISIMIKMYNYRNKITHIHTHLNITLGIHKHYLRKKRHQSSINMKLSLF